MFGGRPFLFYIRRVFSWLKNKYNQFFLGFIISVVVVCSLKMNETHRERNFIVSDGLGYYAYLPAAFIYHDTAYEFKWFNQAYYRHYTVHSFQNPEDNLLVKHGGRNINKYYPGVSFLCLPFFIAAHIIAQIIHAPADGFSFPYQWSIAIAAIFYLVLGLVFLKRLLQKLFRSNWISFTIPVAIFYGTHLFNNAIFSPSLSHVYSFTFITLLCYFTHSFFNEEKNKWRTFLLCAFCFLVVVCIRPLNGIILLALLAFVPKDFFKQKFQFGKFKMAYISFLVLILVLLVYQFNILYTQTGSLFPYTYNNERFYFSDPKLFFVLFSYHAGLFVYVPLAFFALFGIFYLPSWKQKILLPLTFFIVIYLYASWWYWIIVARTLVDFYALLAILLAALLKRIEYSNKIKSIFISVIVLMTAYFHLKNYQIQHHILDTSYTHSELFWKNFLRLKPAHTFAVPPSSILKEQSFYEDFERVEFSNVKPYSGEYALELNQEKEYTPVLSYTVPDFFKEKGLKKIRFSFWSFYTDNINQVHVIMTLHDKENNQLNYIPFYIKEDFIRYNVWDYEQFGVELSDEELNKVALLKIYLWNPERKNAMYIDDVKTEFILTDKSYEIVQ